MFPTETKLPARINHIKRYTAGGMAMGMKPMKYLRQKMMEEFYEQHPFARDVREGSRHYRDLVALARTARAAEQYDEARKHIGEIVVAGPADFRQDSWAGLICGLGAVFGLGSGLAYDIVQQRVSNTGIIVGGSIAAGLGLAYLLTKRADERLSGLERVAEINTEYLRKLKI